MAEVAIPSALQKWAYEKSMGRAERSDSAACSPDLFTAEGIDLPAAKTEGTPSLDTRDPIFQDRYLSSEEDLSPMEPDFDNSDFDDDDLDEVAEVVEATAVAAPVAAQRPKSGDTATTVSYVSAGRPKIVTVPTAPVLKERPSRTSSLAPSPIPDVGRLSRMSISSNSAESSPRLSKEDSIRHRRRSVSFSKASFTTIESAVEIPSRSQTPSAASLHRPSTSRSFAQYTQAARNSLQLLSSKSSSNFHSGNTPLPSPALTTPSFLNSDPFAHGSTSSASPIIKSGNGHKRLRSISRSLALAKIAINKPKAASSNPPTPDLDSPYSPRTPMTPELPFSSQSNRRRMVPRPERESMPPLPTDRRPMSPSVLQKPRPKLVPRGANEREPVLELPPFPTDDEEPTTPAANKASFTNRMSRIKKRKSMLGLA